MKDLSGLKFGKLTVLKYWGCDKYRHSKWLCLCECGNQKIAKEDTLVRGVTYSCGCVTKRGKCNKMQ